MELIHPEGEENPFPALIEIARQKEPAPPRSQVICPICEKPIQPSEFWDQITFASSEGESHPPAHRHCIFLKRTCPNCSQFKDGEDRLRQWLAEHDTVAPPETDVTKRVLTLLAAAQGHQGQYQAYLQLVEEKQRIGLFFRENYSQEIAAGRHSQFADDTECILHYLKGPVRLEEAVKEITESLVREGNLKIQVRNLKIQVEELRRIIDRGWLCRLRRLLGI